MASDISGEDHDEPHQRAMYFAHGARDDSSLGASQGKEIWLGGGRTKAVAREEMPADQNVDAISSALDFHRLCSTRRS